jgi:hypothetical protein
MANDPLVALRMAAKGLLYPSETDAPFRAFAWKGTEPLSARTLRKKSRKSQTTEVRETTLEDFFENLTQDQAWHDDDDRRTVARFRALRKTLEEHLTDPKVFRVGSVNIDVYVVGRAATGDWVGLKTKSVET